MAVEQPALSPDERRILALATTAPLREMRQAILADPMWHSRNVLYAAKNASDIDADLPGKLVSASRDQQAAILLEAARIAAECSQSSNLGGSEVLTALLGYSDFVARQIMQNGIVLSNAETARLIASYAERLDAPDLFPPFCIDREDDDSLIEGVHLFVRTIAPQVRGVGGNPDQQRGASGRPKTQSLPCGVFGRLFRSADKGGNQPDASNAAAFAYEQLMQLAEHGGRSPFLLSHLRQAADRSADLSKPPADPRRDKNRRRSIPRPAHISQADWEYAWTCFENGARLETRRSTYCPDKEPVWQVMPRDEARWIIQDALEPEVFGELTDDEIARRYEEGGAYAIWLRRAAPVFGRTSVTSYFGGLPRLAPELVWPRTSKDKRALFFAAQIDCAEITDFAEAGAAGLPKHGTLYFFVHPYDTGEMEALGRVLYSERETAAIPVAAPPDRPLSIVGNTEEFSLLADNWIEPALMPDRVPTMFEQWEITPVRRKTFSYAARSALVDDLYRGSDLDQVGKADRRIEPIMEASHFNAHREALGEEPPSKPPYQSDELFPRAWYFVTTHAAGVLGHAWRFMKELEHPHRVNGFPADIRAPLAPCLAEIAREAENWVAEADCMAPDEPVPEDSRNAFNRWRDTIEQRLGFAKAWGQRYKLLAVGTDQAAARYLIAHSPRAAEVVPQALMAWSRFHADGGHYGVHHMLGFADEEYQDEHAPRSNGYILLMQLRTDYGMNWMWNDCNSMQFWIKPADLAERRFDRVMVKISG